MKYDNNMNMKVYLYLSFFLAFPRFFENYLSGEQLRTSLVKINEKIYKIHFLYNFLLPCYKYY